MCRLPSWRRWHSYWWKELLVEDKNSITEGFNLDDIPADVFELADQGLTVESLTRGHGLVENGASFPSCGSSCSSLP